VELLNCGAFLDPGGAIKIQRACSKPITDILYQNITDRRPRFILSLSLGRSEFMFVFHLYLLFNVIPKIF